MLPTKRVHNFGTYFVTANCAGKRSLFQVERSSELMFEVLQHYRGHYKLHAFVLMPNHFHLLLTPQDITLERCLQLIKGGFSRRYHLDGGLKDVWQKGYADHRVSDREDYLKHKTYVEQNPVKSGLTSSAEDYGWSSASHSLRQKHPSAAEAAVSLHLNGMAEAMPLRKQQQQACRLGEDAWHG